MSSAEDNKPEIEVTHEEEAGASGADDAEGSAQKTPNSKKKGRTYQKVGNLSDFYNPVAYTSQSKGPGKGKGEKGKGKGDGEDRKGKGKGGYFQDGAPPAQMGDDQSSPDGAPGPLDDGKGGKKKQMGGPGGKGSRDGGKGGKMGGGANAPGGKGAPGQPQRKGNLGGKGPRGPMSEGMPDAAGVPEPGPEGPGGPKGPMPAGGKGGPGPNGMVGMPMGGGPMSFGMPAFPMGGPMGAMPMYTPTVPGGGGMAYMAYPMSYVMQPPNMPGGPFGAMPGAPGSAPPAEPTPQDRATRVASVQNQIDYYFGIDNLLKDVFLRKHMNEEGWVPINLLAGFRRIQSMTMDLSIVMEAISASTIIETNAQNTHIRTKDEWQRWVLAPQASTPAAGGEARPNP